MTGVIDANVSEVYTTDTDFLQFRGIRVINPVRDGVAAR